MSTPLEVKAATFRLRLVFTTLLFDSSAQSSGRNARRRHLPEVLFKKTLAQAQFPLRRKCKQSSSLERTSGTIRATGWLRSRTRISSPAFTSLRYKLKRFFNSAMVTLFMDRPRFRSADKLLTRHDFMSSIAIKKTLQTRASEKLCISNLPESPFWKHQIAGGANWNLTLSGSAVKK